MELRLLGPLEARSNGQPLQLTRPKPRALLALLALTPGREVDVSRLVDGLWGENPPSSAGKTLHTYVSQLRRLLGTEVIATTPSGYRLDVDEEAVDHVRFRSLAAAAASKDDPAEVDHLLGTALDLWRGRPFPELEDDPSALAEAEGLEELRLAAVEQRAAARLELGRHAEVIAEMRNLLAAHPLREAAWGLLMQALYRAGRQGEALRAFGEARAVLVEELGIEPAPELQALEERILHQDPSLSPAPAAAPVAGKERVERRWVSVMAARAPGLGEEWRRLAGREITRFGGVPLVDGDVVFGVFGLPAAHEDDAERAVRAALSAASRVRALLGGGGDARFGVESHQPLVAWREQGGEVALQPVRTLVAPALELLAGAGPWQVLVGEQALEGSERAVRYEEHPSGWMALGPAEREARRLPATELVGRTSELATLEAVWSHVASERRPRLVTVTGPPGIGKTRLVEELLGRVETFGARVLRSRSLAYGDTTYGALAEVVREVVGLGPAHGAAEVRDRLGAWLSLHLPPSERGREPHHVLALLAMLGDIVESRSALVHAVRHVLEAAGRRPAVVLLDDLHWASDALLEVLHASVARLRRVPLLLVAVARPELLDRRPTWGGGLPAHFALELGPLAEEETTSLAAALLGNGQEVEGIRRVSGGNPLFVEELSAWVGEGRDLRSGIPATVRAALVARLDTLPSAAREVLLQAALVGNPFWLGALAAVRHTSDGLVEALDELELRGFVHRSSSSSLVGDEELSFRHDLIAEVASSLVAEEERRRVHGEVARFLEAAAGPGAAPANLAHHWRQAGDEERGIRYLIEAADQANRGWTRERATALYDRALELLPEGDERRRGVQLRRAVALQAWAHTVLDVVRRPEG